MRKNFLLLFVWVIILCGCTNTDYKTQIFSVVEENTELLSDYVLDNDSIGDITEELSNLNIQEIEFIDSDEIIVFEMYYTGLFDGGVEYGFYYSENDNKLNKQSSSNDYMVIEEILDNWYYYEWHNG